MGGKRFLGGPGFGGLSGMVSSDGASGGEVRADKGLGHLSACGPCQSGLAWTGKVLWDEGMTG